MNYHKKLISFLLIIIVLVGVFSFRVEKANAQFGGVVSVVNSIPQTLRNIWDKIEKAWDKVQGWVGADLANRTMEMFMNDLAYQVATELATGGTGGKPLFRTESITKSLQHAQEAAVGEFIGQISNTYFADLGLNLCEPSLQVKLTFTLSLIDKESPPAQPKCNWRDVQKRWESFGDDQSTRASLLQFQFSPQAGPGGVEDYFKAFSLEQSDLGVFAKLQGEINNRKAVSVEVLKLDAAECQGFKDKKTAVTDEVKTHCRTILNLNEEEWASAVADTADKIAARKEAATNRKLSDIIKDAASNFANTLTSKLMKKWIQGGMWSAFGRSQNQPGYRDTLLAQLRGGGDIRQPRDADIFTDFKSIKISPIESYSFVDDFSVCPEDAQFRKPDNCVMSTDFLQAASNKLTVKEAVERGVLNGAWQFINPSDALRNSQECYSGAYCYNNLVKLRKANIIPVGWEMVSSRSDLVTPVTLRQALDCFEDTDCPFPSNDMAYAVDGEAHNPFYHLVDPNWVLKIPQAYCSAFVYAPVLEAAESSNRQQYCADAQVCLQEDDDGNCLDNQYGYCTKSENIWRLGGDQCIDGDIYSGCLIFEHPEIGRQTYLEQSLSYCSADQAGCKRYSQEMNQDGNWVLQDMATDNNDLFLNRQAKDCPSSEADCHEYIVMATDRGINLLSNGGLDDINSDGSVDGWDPAMPSADVEYIDGRIRVHDRVSHKFYLLPNTDYVLSADATQVISGGAEQAGINVEFCDNTGNCTSGNAGGAVAGVGTCIIDNTGVPMASLQFIPAGTETERKSCSFRTNQYVGSAFIVPDQIEVWYDNFKVEIVSSVDRIASPYSDYGVGGKITMDGTRFMCTADELGCQGYTPINGGPMIPAVVNPSDLCPAQCVGYNSFAETPSIFSVMEGDSDFQYYNFIPNTAKTCPSSAIGCEEFTNLDEVAQGGEGKEYFTYIRQCVPENLGTTYYTWEGSDSAGYQIRTWQILESNLDTGPCTNIDPNGVICTDTPATMASCDAAQAAVDPNCRQFFTESGLVDFYRLQDRVIFASSDCHEYRRTLSGAVYKTIPSLNIGCSAEFNGCHLYTGNTANNVREIFANNFEQGTFAPWETAPVSAIDLSSESLENNGHSIKIVKGAAQLNLMRPLDNIISGNKQYQVSWWMKNDTVIDYMTVSMINGSGIPDAKFFHDLPSQLQNISAGSWRYFTLTRTIDTSTFVDINDIKLDLTIMNGGVGNIYFDNIILKEVGDNISVIRNSWTTPIACDSPYVGYHLGCQSYQDTNRRVFNLRSFSNLCRVDAIGCSAAIDTHNSTYPYEETFNVGNNAEITVPADNMAYLVPDSAKYCSTEYKGCQALGLPDRNNEYLLNTVYKINNPDQYASTLCDTDGLGCEEYASDKGVYYFRDPASQTCTYKVNYRFNNSSYSGWFKTSSLDTSNVLGCSDSDGVFDTDSSDEDGDDLAFNDCVWATVDGLNGFFRKDSLLTVHPVGCWPNNVAGLDAGDIATTNLAALCPEEKNLCTTLRDPSDPETCDPSIDSNVLKGVCRNIDDGHVIGYINTAGDLVDYDSAAACESAVATGVPETNGPARWYSSCQDYYYYKNSNIDQTSCAGSVDKKGGCILLYDANDWMSNHEEVRVLYDSGKTYDENLATDRAVSPTACNPEIDASCALDSNMLVKVKKDRQCSEWLACRSSAAVWDQDNNRYKTVCDDVAACTEYDRNNNITKCKEWAPLNPNLAPLSTPFYQNRDTGTNDHLQWGDDEYLGYSIPNLLPIKDLAVNQFNNGDTRIVYQYFDTVTNDGNYAADCRDAAGINNINGIACTAGIPAGVFIGECQNGFCWLAPKMGETSTSTLALNTRGYAMSDAPFPHNVYFDKDESKGRRQSYNGANVCQTDRSDINDIKLVPDGCEQSYRKVTYGAGTERYYPVDIPFPLRICTAGKVEFSGPNSIYQCNDNADCNSIDESGNFRDDGFCEKQTKADIVNNWSGICLDYDYANQIIKDTGSSYYCNQWYPAEQISGTNSLYENYQEAGYHEQYGRDALFCAISEPYILPETRYYCASAWTYLGREYCMVIAEVPAGTKVSLPLMDNSANGNLYINTLINGYLRSDKLSIYGPNDPATASTPFGNIVFNGRALDMQSPEVLNPTVGLNWRDTITYDGLGVDWLHRVDADPLWDINANWRNNYRDALGSTAGMRDEEDSSLFMATDFGRSISSNIPVLPLSSISSIFDADNATGIVKLYFYDSYVNRDGNWGGTATIQPYDLYNAPNHAEYLPIGMYQEYGVQLTEDRWSNPLFQCMPGWHEAWFNAQVDGDFNRFNVGGFDQRGWDGDQHLEESRWCSPMPHGIYVSPAFVGENSTITQCNEEDCGDVEAGPGSNDSFQCFDANAYYISIAIPVDCAGNLHCEYKKCIENLQISSPSHPAGALWCSDLGDATAVTLDVTYDCPSGAVHHEYYSDYGGVSGCLDIIYDLVVTTIPNTKVYNGETCQILGPLNQTYRDLVAMASVNAQLLSAVDICTDSDEPEGPTLDCNTITVEVGTGFKDLSSIYCRGSRRCYVRGDRYTPGTFGNDCTGLGCYQQCQIITQLDANADKSWVRTDMWWRYSQNTLRVHDTSPNDWISYYYLAGVTGATYEWGTELHYTGVTGVVENVFTHFGAALEYFNEDKEVITRIPLSNSWVDQPSTATFFSATNWTDAADNMSKLFARAYNLELINGRYEYDTTRPLDDASEGPNTFAGDDYNPRVLKVCGDSACAVRDSNNNIVGYQSGITINEQQEGDLEADESLFVAVKAYFYAHPDHMPVTNIIMDWGDNNISSSPGRYKNALFSCNPDDNMPNICTDDTTASCNVLPANFLQGFGGLDNACRQGYKIFYHDYQFTTAPAFQCNGDPVGEPNVAGAACFKPSMYVVDHWNLGGTDDDDNAIPYDDWIVVHP